jgi:hypothetical protein
MPTSPHQSSSRRTARRTPAPSGLPDPRPLTEYAALLTPVAGHDEIIVTLDQPCVIRQPAWAVIDAADGSRIVPTGVSVAGETVFVLQFAGTLPASAGFIEVPYQDREVQNFQGGFVAPGARWFRPAA